MNNKNYYQLIAGSLNAKLKGLKIQERNMKKSLPFTVSPTFHRLLTIILETHTPSDRPKMSS